MNERQIVKKKSISQTCHFPMIINVGRNYFPQNFLMVSFNEKLYC